MSENISHFSGGKRGRFLVSLRAAKDTLDDVFSGRTRADVVQWSANEMWFTINQKIVKFPSPYQQRLRLFIKREGDILHGRAYPPFPCNHVGCLTRHFPTTPFSPRPFLIAQLARHKAEVGEMQKLFHTQTTFTYFDQ